MYERRPIIAALLVSGCVWALILALEQQPASATTETEASSEQVNAILERANGFNTDSRFEIDKLDRNCNLFFGWFDGAHNITIGQVAQIALAAKHKFTQYLGYSSHRYDNYKELRLSGGPQVDQDLCLQQLEDLNRRARVQLAEKMHSMDVNLYQLLDTFGQAPPGLTSGNVFWPGAYTRCLRLKIAALGREHESRFCWAALKLKSWLQGAPSGSEGDGLQHQVLKAGVCLPKACDSLDYKHKYQLIESLVELQNHKFVYRDELKLVDLFCLPDEESPLRLWHRDDRNLALVVLSGAWLAALVYFTLTGKAKSLSITENLVKLFDCSDRTDEQGSAESVVNFDVLDGLKVRAAVFIVIAHSLAYVSKVSTNEQEAAGLSNSIPYLIANMPPAFIVNTFFAITGVLTSYYSFKHNEKHHFISSPLSWCALIARRYLRIMPTYIIVVAYLKYLAKFTGSGPFWDYATSSLGQRRRCEQESWLLTVLLGANLKPPLEQCVPSAWYLANDFQFFVATPLLLILLQKSPVLGRRLLIYATFLLVLGGVLDILYERTGDLSPVASYAPYGFRTYIFYLSASYSQPLHRLPAYLCGVLAGHSLYRYQERVKSEPKAVEGYDSGILASLCSTYLTIGPFVTPLVSRLFSYSELSAKLIISVGMPTFHCLYSLCVCNYVIHATTRAAPTLMDKFLSAKLWRPLARLSLCVLLINIEVIEHLNQISTYTQAMDSKTLTQVYLLNISATYLVSVPAYVLVEAPIKNVINLAIGWLSLRLRSRAGRKIKLL